MGQSKCSTFLSPATMTNLHLQCLEIQTFWNTPGISRISLVATTILTTSIVNKGVINCCFHMTLEIKIKI